ncbi:type IV pilus modification protein PilV [Rhizobacter sp. LjRoot28]|uniref:type IV pilus modification protein PilV n=1 Tax=Rhizobacter sp. LjRoot28 TaxID=3342309 RepID=UPI003ED0E792
MKPILRAHRRRSASVAQSRGARGVVLIEALVGIMIFSIGVLGLVGLQAAMVKAQTEANYRAEAAQLAQDLVGRMWVDTENLAAYHDADACKSLDPCSQWLDRVAERLPGAVSPEVKLVDGGRTEIVLAWITPGEPEKDGRHAFRTVTAVSGQPPKD